VWWEESTRNGPKEQPSVESSTSMTPLQTKVVAPAPTAASRSDTADFAGLYQVSMHQV